MIVRLTRHQQHRLMEIVGDQMSERWSEGVLAWLTQDVADASGRRVDVAMPAIAWKRVWDVLFDHVFDNRGMRSRGVKVSEMNAIKAVRRGLNVREVHPALSGAGAIGFVAELVPAWRYLEPEGGFTYSPYPLAGLPFVILAPESRRVQHQKVTAWVPMSAVPDRPLLIEAEHLRFA